MFLSLHSIFISRINAFLVSFEPSQSVSIFTVFNFLVSYRFTSVNSYIPTAATLWKLCRFYCITITNISIRKLSKFFLVKHLFFISRLLLNIKYTKISNEVRLNECSTCTSTSTTMRWRPYVPSE